MALLPGLERLLNASPLRRLAVNTAAPIAARLFDAAFALIYLRILGSPAVGAYQFVVVLTTLLDTLIDFGLNALIAREVPRGNVSAEAAFRSVGVLRLGLWLVGLPVVIITYGPLSQVSHLPPEATTAGWIYYAALLPSVLAKTSSGVLWAAERLEFTAGVSVLATLVRNGLGAIVLFGGFGLIGLASASLATNVVTATVLWRLSLAARARLTAHAQAAAPKWLMESWPLFVNQLLQSVFFKVDALLLPALAGTAAAGVYAAAYKVSEGAGIVSSSFTLALFPRLSRETDLASAYRLALRVLLQIGLPLAVGLSLLSESVIQVVGGRGYLPDSAIALSILIAYLPLSYANGLTQYVLIAAGRQRWLTLAFVAVLVFNVGGNLVLIPRLSYIGAAWVTVASEIVLLVPFQIFAARITPGVSLLNEIRVPILATLLMAPVVWWLRDAIHPIAAIIAGAAIYPVALWSLGGIDERQWRLLHQFIRPASRLSS